MPNPDTFGWDTVFAVPLPLFNNAIADFKPQQRQFSFASSGEGAADSDLQWVFGPWQVEDVYGAQFILSSTLQDGLLKSGNASIDLARVVCRLTVNMVLKSNADQVHLSKPAAAAAALGDPWAIVDVQFPSDASIADQLLVQQAFISWFATDDGSKAFDAIFDGLRINSDAAGKTVWLKPQASRLAGAVLPDKKLAIGFLANTMSNSIAGRPLQLSPFAIPADADAAFLISPERVLTGMIAPALPHVFGTSPDTVCSDFPVLGGTRIANASSLTFPVKTSDGKTYTAAIAPSDLSIVLANDRLTITIEKMSFEIDLGRINLETINIRTVEQLKATLAVAPDDPSHRVLLLAQAADPIVEHDTEESLYAIGGELLVGIVTTIAAALIAKFVPGGLTSRFGISMIAAKIWAGVMVMVAAGMGMLIAKIPDLIASSEDVDLKTLPSFGSLIGDALSAIEWPTPQRFEVGSVAFADCLMVGLKRAKAA